MHPVKSELVDDGGLYYVSSFATSSIILILQTYEGTIVVTGRHYRG